MNDYIKNLSFKIKPVHKRFYSEGRARLDKMAIPRGSLGRLEELAERFYAIRGGTNLKAGRKVIFTFAADHGIVEEGVSAFPKDVTPQMVFNFLKGGAGVNVLSRHNNIEVVVVDIGVDYDFSPAAGLIIKKVDRGTKNFSKSPAMTIDQAEKAMSIGIEIAEEWIKKGADILGTGDMGIGNTTPSSAIISLISGRSVEEVTGRGTGISDEGFKRKVAAIKRGIEINKPDINDPIDILAKVGGFEIGGIAGLILGGAANSIPVVIDGLISSAAALIAYKINPHVKDYIFTSHKSVEVGHSVCFDIIGHPPLFDLNMRLGEGTGSALGIGLLEVSVKLLTEMATFEEAKVSKGEDSLYEISHAEPRRTQIC